MTPAKALYEFVLAQVTIAGCCRALEPLVLLARAGDAEAAKLAATALRWIIEERKG